MLDDLEAYAAGYSASLLVTADEGAPIESASVTLQVFALVDAAGVAAWAGDMIAALLEQGPARAGFSTTATTTGVIHQQLARLAVPHDPEGVATFSSVVALRDALVAAGLPCPAWVQDDAIPAAIESGRCSPSTLLMLFDSPRSQIAVMDSCRSAETGLKQEGQKPIPMLVGPNWVALTPEAYDVAPLLGGGVYAR